VVTLHRALPEEARRDYRIGNIAVAVDAVAWLVELFGTHFTCETLASAHWRWSEAEPTRRPLLAIAFGGGELLWHDRLGYAARALLARDRRLALGLLGDLGPGEGLDHTSIAVRAIQRAKDLAPGASLALVARAEDAIGGATRSGWDGLTTWDQGCALARGGHEIEPHPLSHPILTLVDESQLEREPAGSKARLEAPVGTSYESLWSPNGDQDDRVSGATRRAGYLRAVTTARGNNPPGANPLQLSRCEIQSKVARSVPRLALRLSPHFSRLVA
jgi:hypothetical protein